MLRKNFKAYYRVIENMINFSDKKRFLMDAIQFINGDYFILNSDMYDITRDNNENKEEDENENNDELG